mmetsp:Transcript_15010/g.48004  ORF Transcript_15010/g.48004 Transcript_15010/m.48004 type:complete len:216 (+) Transcript_15010:265-912(+)
MLRSPSGWIPSRGELAARRGAPTQGAALSQAAGARWPWSCAARIMPRTLWHSPGGAAAMMRWTALRFEVRRFRPPSARKSIATVRSCSPACGAAGSVRSSSWHPRTWARGSRFPSVGGASGPAPPSCPRAWSSCAGGGGTSRWAVGAPAAACSCRRRLPGAGGCRWTWTFACGRQLPQQGLAAGRRGRRPGRTPSGFIPQVRALTMRSPWALIRL